MELFDNLASVGLTTRILQFIIIGGIAIFLIGMFWRYIVVGAGIAFCVAVFAMPSKSDKAEVTPVVESKPIVPQEYKVEQMPNEPPLVEVKPELKAETKEQADERMFLEDCNLHSGYTKSQCRALWESDKDEIMKSNWRFNQKGRMQKVKNART